MLIGWRESVASVAIKENGNPWTITASDAVLWTPDSGKKQYIVIFCPKTPKKERSSFLGNCRGIDQTGTGKEFHIRKILNGLNQIKAAKLLLWKIILWKLFSTTATRFFQLPTYTTPGKFFHHYLPTIGIQCTTFVAEEYFTPFALSNVQLQKNTKLSLWS